VERRLGILEADEVDGPLRERYGDYPAMFATLLGGSNELELRVYHATRGELPLTPDENDAYLITGSRHSVYDDEPWIHALGDFVVRADAARRKLVGICFGHQLIAHVLGGRTEPAAVGWCVGVQKNDIMLPLAWMDPERETVFLPASHRDQVAVLPDRARVFATSERCPIAGYVIDDHILAIQAHPEFAKPYSRALLERRRPLIGEERYQEAVGSYRIETDQPLLGRWIKRFLEDDRANA
jgi:GMP synthase-like glutamine amidotransferase